MAARAMCASRVVWLALLGGLGGAPGCQSYANLEASGPTQAQFSLQGQALLDLPVVESPVWVMFVIDCSQSMVRNDPIPWGGVPARVRALEEFLDAHADRTDMRFGIVRFGEQAIILTQRDSEGDGLADQFLMADGPMLRGVLAHLVDAAGVTDYGEALSQAVYALAADLRHAPADTRVQVIMLSDDGRQSIAPDHPGGMSMLLDEVDRLTGLADRGEVDEVRLHTVQLAEAEEVTGDLTHRIPNQAVLKRLALEGAGTYLQVRSPEDLSFLNVDTSPATRGALPGPVRVLVANLCALPGPAGPVPDSDADGLADSDEILTGTDPLVADSDGDGFADGIERWLGPPFDPLATNACPSPSDSDGDGLPACAEVHLGTDATRVDTDGDGLPDSLELWAGSDPLSPTAGAPPPGVHEAATERTPQADGLNERIGFRIQDLPLGRSQSGDDILQIWLGGPDGSYRMACLAVPPPPGVLEITLNDSDFGLPEACP